MSDQPLPAGGRAVPGGRLTANWEGMRQEYLEQITLLYPQQTDNAFLKRLRPSAIRFDNLAITRNVHDEGGYTRRLETTREKSDTQLDYAVMFC